MQSQTAIARIVHKQILRCSPQTLIADAARFMASAQCSAIVVCSGDTPVGIWTERDALRLDFADPEAFNRPITSVMSSPVKTIGAETSIREAGPLFKKEGVRHFVVVDASGTPVGIVNQTDVILRHGVEHFLMLTNVATALSPGMTCIPGDTSLVEAVKLMNQAGLDAAVVMDEKGEEPGIVTERDVVRWIAAGISPDAPVSTVASKPLVCIQDDDSLLNARKILERLNIRHLAVRGSDGALKGLLSHTCILEAIKYDYVRQLDDALKERDDALARSRQELDLANKVIQASLDAIMITDAQGRIEFVNPAFSTLTGYQADEVLGQNPRMLQSGRHDSQFYGALWHSLKQAGWWQGEIWNRRKNGEIFPEWLTINAIRDDVSGSLRFAAIFSDITERKRTEERIKNLAYFDVLTALPNRRMFTDRLQMALAGALRHKSGLAIMFLDLDLFKRINDTLGHSVGDQVLVATAQRLSRCVRECDTVARLGGDEFIILLPELADAGDTAKLAARIISQIRQPFLIEGHELYVTASIGIAVYPDDGSSIDALTKNADTAMYRAKDLGRNTYQHYSPAMNERSFERLAMEASLRHALARREFLLAYQVKIDLATGRMSGVEALVRWLHPQMGLVSPGEFIPLAENMGIISDIGAWVLEAACRQCKEWHDLGLPKVSIAVNVSALQFRESDVAAVVAKALGLSGLEPQYLELELTESVLMQRVDEVVDVLLELRSMGVRISVDDFGTGYSSLSYLKRMPIDALKIDRSFVHDIAGNGEGMEIVSTIIDLAHNLKLKAVAEGVETQTQADYLKQWGCDEIQGFLISRPVSSGDLISLFNRNLLPEASVD